MRNPRVFTDEQLIKHWEDTGNIRETTRRLKATYFSVYRQLVRLNLIRSPTFDAGRQSPTARTIPEGTTLVIPDLQAPAHHPDALAFLCAIRDKYLPKNIVCIGDELDRARVQAQAYGNQFSAQSALDRAFELFTNKSLYF